MFKFHFGETYPYVTHKIRKFLRILNETETEKFKMDMTRQLF